MKQRFVVEELDPRTLTSNPANFRRHPDSQRRALRASLDEHGAVAAPIFNLTTRHLIDGHARVEMALEDGEERILVNVVEMPLAQEKRLLRSFDQITSMALVDDEALDALIAEIDDAALEQLLGEVAEPESGLLPEADPDAIPENVATRCQNGDLWQLGAHRLLCGDSTKREDVERLLGGKRVDAMVTDPPYCSGGFQEAGKHAGSVGTRGDEMIANDTLSTRGYTALIKSVLSLVNPGVIYVFTDWRMWVNLFDVAESCCYGVRNMVVWDKGSPGMGRGWRSQHELILVGMKVTQPFDPHRAQGNVIGCQRTGNVNHATEKPVELISTILEVTDMAKVIYEPFAGSGTTLVACEQMDRACFALELEPRYCDVVIARFEQATGKTAERL